MNAVCKIGIKVCRVWACIGALWMFGHGFARAQSGKTETWLDFYKDSEPLWWIERLNLRFALEAIKDRAVSSPIIALVDSGVDIHHPAFSDSIARQDSDLCPGASWGCDATKAKKGRLGEGGWQPFGWDSASQTCHRSSPDYGSCIHGTHVAGILVGGGQNGVFGVCPMCRILVIKVVEHKKGVSDQAIVGALQYVYALQKKLGGGIRVINLSFGKFQRSEAVAWTLKKLASERILVVGAAGNENTLRRVYPGAARDVLSVGAFQFLGELASYSNFGPWVNILGPGGDSFDGGIFSAIPGGGISASQGTSVATPFVAGAAALLASLDPTLRAGQIRQILLDTAEGETPGRLDMGAAIMRVLGGELFLTQPTPPKPLNQELGCGEVRNTPLSGGGWIGLFFLLLPFLVLKIMQGFLKTRH